MGAGGRGRRDDFSLLLVNIQLQLSDANESFMARDVNETVSLDEPP